MKKYGVFDKNILVDTFESENFNLAMLDAKLRFGIDDTMNMAHLLLVELNR